MKLASLSERISNAGAEVIAISVDGDERTAAMPARWPTPHVRYVSDPGGERYLQPMDMFDSNERDGIALPGLFVIDPDGNEVFGYRGNDFADRRNDEDLFAELEPLGQLRSRRPLEAQPPCRMAMRPRSNRRARLRQSYSGRTSRATSSVQSRSGCVPKATRQRRWLASIATWRSRCSMLGQA